MIITSYTVESAVITSPVSKTRYYNEKNKKNTIRNVIYIAMRK